MTVIQLLQELRRTERLPWSVENKPPAGRQPSSSEIHRWLKNGSVLIDGRKATAADVVSLPVGELVFFPKGRRVTMGGFDLCGLECCA